MVFVGRIGLIGLGGVRVTYNLSVVMLQM